ncbi:MAG: Gmad2 immunoglobulin-like domain-containing protein [Candidatus Dojkabacteria bacterium]|nr:Gmad2 immunoglobulin-like domain-containing protein [Candidatus Dojkabacteria bacterium]
MQSFKLSTRRYLLLALGLVIVSFVMLVVISLSSISVNIFSPHNKNLNNNIDIKNNNSRINQTNNSVNNVNECEKSSESKNVILKVSCNYPDTIVSINNILQISGKAKNIFENTLNFVILDSNSNTLYEDVVFVNSIDFITYGDFSKEIYLNEDQNNNDIKLKIFQRSAKDGSEIDIIVVNILKN